jgi:hypothetical protein
MQSEPNEDVDSRQDSQLAEAAARRSSGIVQADQADAPVSGEQPEPVESSTAAGNPIAGREVSQADANDTLERSSES